MAYTCRKCGCETGTIGCPGGKHHLCGDCWREEYPDEAERHQDAQNKLGYWIFFGPFYLLWLLRKPIVWCCKKIGYACWVVMKNKWTWTIFTCGFSWVAWKMLDAIYNPKD